jgi:UDP-N-acetylmuramoylalanine--D-glutamate ligase
VIPLPFAANEFYAVLGLGASGLSAARALLASGAKVAAWDDSSAKRDAALGAGIPVANLIDLDFNPLKALVLSPGIPSSFPKPHPVTAKAKAANIPIICDVELLVRGQAPARFLGITGTNGKSTVTALLGHILHQSGLSTEIGGNLGPAALGLNALGSNGNYVIELSSYQLELMQTRGLTAGVLLNVTPDHLDRHGGMDGYIAAKKRLFGLIKDAGTAVIGLDDEPCRAIAAELQAEGRLKVIGISANRTVGGGVYALGGRLVDDTAGRAERVLSLEDAVALPGVHNAQNAAAAFAAARAFGLDPDRIAQAIASYPGLAHRQERVAIVSGIQFVNDSKATNGDATSKALACYGSIYWIAGGLAKEGGIEGLDPFWPRIRHAYLIGKAADDFAVTLKGHVTTTMSGTLEAATRAAFAQARADGAQDSVVLLSPACASFDQFANFEARGDAFKSLVTTIARETQREGVSA